MIRSFGSNCCCEMLYFDISITVEWMVERRERIQAGL
jgi:hypothetical protein